MDTLSSSSSYRDEEGGIFCNMHVALLRLDDNDNDDDDVDMEIPRALLLGGAGIGKPYRKKPRKYNEAGGTPLAQRKRCHVHPPWSTKYFRAPLRPRLCRSILSA